MEDAGVPGAYAVGGADSNRYDDENEEGTYEDSGLGNLDNLTEAIVDVPVAAALVSDEVVVATPVTSELMDVHRAERILLQMHLCITDRETRPLDEAAVTKLLKEFPNLFREKHPLESDDSKTILLYPLCLILRLQPSIKLVKAIYDVHPIALRDIDECGCLPIHFAARWGADIRIVTFLLDAYPESVFTPDSEGQLALHHSCLWSKSWKVTEFLISRYPETIEHARKDNALPLHLTIQTDGPESTILKLLERYPKAASIANKDALMPLHLVCMQKSEIRASIVRALLKLHPEAARTVTPEPFTSLALHMACQFRAPAGVISMLLDTFPEGVSRKDGYGFLPLHYLANCHNDTIVLKVFRLFPGAAREKGFNGGFALHAALKSKKSEEVIMELLSAYPEVAKIANNQGRLPLHIALSKKGGYSSACIAHILSLNEDASRKCNNDGLAVYPLHLDCMNYEDSSITIKLINLFPEALQVRGERGRLPLHLIVSNKDRCNDVQTVREMLRIYPKAAKTKDKRGNLPLALAVESNACLEMQKLLSP
ncbi:Ankyrin Repeat [Seminavis robusta]|uniref:Ankyrin Repeat n=1 Tax=Seminavis robusta TaxID=568900 RepID=A0A9N8HBP0_9STRA|nr:Ankyrin Repeat [Seminavis robusta]|eukprot:Sro190_g081710.1 Ankyrin Repeat (542) ;mRNA; r:12289-14013